MAFRFRLQTLLNLRNSQERAERLALTRIRQELAETDRLLDDIRRQRAESGEALTRELMSGLLANEVHFQLEIEREQEARRVPLLERRRQLEEDYLRQRRVFSQVRQKRETLEKLSDDDKTAHELEARRRDQAESDEWFLHSTRNTSN